MPKRLWIVGQAPARSSEPGQRALDSASGRRLASWMGTDLATMLEHAETINLNQVLVGTHGKWDEFDLAQARDTAQVLHERLIAADHAVVVLCLGVRVSMVMAAEFGLTSVLYRWVVVDGRHHMTGIPHPSGTNMHYNERANVEMATAMVKGVWRTSERLERESWS